MSSLISLLCSRAKLTCGGSACALTETTTVEWSMSGITAWPSPSLTGTETSRVSARLDDVSRLYRAAGVARFSPGGHLPFLSTDSGDGSCVAMTSGQVGGFWDDKPCADKYKFLCEKFRPDISPPTEAPTPPPSQGCAEGWTAKPHFRNCYRVKIQQLW